MTDLIKQPTAAPTRKVTAAALWGLAMTMALSAAKVFWPDLVAPLGTFLPIAAPWATGLIAAYVTHEAG